MYFIYNILAITLVILAMPVFLYRTLREPGFAERLRQSFGFLPPDILLPVARRGCVWLHAASVGEIVATSPIVKEIRRELPERPILISVVTASGYLMAKRIIKDADSIIFFPLDLPWLSASVVAKICPAVFLPVETELWPNFLKAARKNSVPVMMVNGRISDKSVTRYRYLRSVLRDMLSTVVRFCMQSTIDAQYIIRLGADPRRVIVTGNTKYDQSYTDVTSDERAALCAEMGITDAFPILVAGSTHKGEEGPLFSAFNKVKSEFPSAKLVLAPREPLRVAEVADLAAQYKLKTARRTQLFKQPATGHDIVLIDTIGELGKIYSVGELIYVGGSLIAHGGHNILEPAAHGKAIFVGPNMFNFKDTYALFSGREACITVHDAEDMTGKFLEVIKDEDLRKKMAEATLAIIRENRGASHRSTLYLKELLDTVSSQSWKRRN